MLEALTGPGGGRGEHGPGRAAQGQVRGGEDVDTAGAGTSGWVLKLADDFPAGGWAGAVGEAEAGRPCGRVLCLSG